MMRVVQTVLVPLIHPIGLNGVPSGIGEVDFYVPLQAEGHCKHITVDRLVANPLTCLTGHIRKEVVPMLTRVWNMTLR
jgi:hypothetical protein